MPEDSEVGEILRNNRAEVVSMCLEEYTQEYVDELHEIELDRFKKRAEDAEVRADEAETRADEAETRADEAETRADEAETRADKAETRADSLAELARRYGIPEEQIAATEGK